MSGKKKIFISYQRGHVDEIKRLVSSLEKTGKYDVWYDQKIERGKWWDHIINNLRDADVVVLAVSRTYLASIPCKLERDYARQLNKAILPVTVDSALNYADLPREIVELQVKRYFGSADEFLDLTAALDQEQSPSLPDPLPKPPPAPIDTKADTPTASASRSNRYLIGGGVSLLVVIIALLVFANRPPNSAAEPTATLASSTAEETVSPSASDSPTLTPSQPGPFDITLMYGGLDSFAVRINKPSNLMGVLLTTSAGASENLLARFPDLATYEETIPEGLCLIYEREDTNPTLPLACDDENVQRLSLSPSSVFWFDDGTNLYNNIILRRGEFRKLCPHNNGGGDCDVSAE